MTFPNGSEFPPGLQGRKDNGSSWHTAYMAAISETDRLQLPARIRYAAQVILKREQELLRQKADPDERRALNNALNALRTLITYAIPKAG